MNNTQGHDKSMLHERAPTPTPTPTLTLTNPKKTPTNSRLDGDGVGDNFKSNLLIFRVNNLPTQGCFCAPVPGAKWAGSF